MERLQSKEQKKIEKLEAKLKEIKAEKALLASANARLSTIMRANGLDGAPPVLDPMEALRAVEVDGATPEQLADRYMIKLATAKRKIADGVYHLGRLNKISAIEKLPWQLQVLRLATMTASEAAKTKSAVWRRFHPEARKRFAGREVLRSFVCRHLRLARCKHRGATFDVEGAIDGLQEVLDNTARNDLPEELKAMEWMYGYQTTARTT